jgi:hypothetical protein
MNLISMMDALLRDPDSVHQMAAEGKNLGRLCARLLLIFALGAALYGAVMGGFRVIHPQYVLTDFELSAPDRAPLRGRIAGISVPQRAVYTSVPGLSSADGYKIRFNLTRPTEPATVKSIGTEKGYSRIELASGSDLRETSVWLMPLLVAVKTPLLFLLTLAVCALALYVLNLAFEIRLHFMPVMTAMAFGLASTGVMLGVFVPITGFFSVVTENYHFMKVLHVITFALAGLVGVKALYRGLVKLAPGGARGVRALLFSWVLLYSLVGGQMAWTLKPFLGTPYLPATPPFRVESGNIYVSFFSSLGQMVRGFD